MQYHLLFCNMFRPQRAIFIAYLHWTTKIINHEVSVDINFLLLEDFYINT